jgi:hypothetical protein
MKRMLSVLIGMTCWSTSGCAYEAPLDDWVQGDLVMQARFPRQIQIIPTGTQRIEIRVSGEGVPKGAVLAATLTPDQTMATFTGVPAGKKTVVAKAFDSHGAVLAAGASDVTIIAGATVAARIRLGLLNDGGEFQLILE